MCISAVEDELQELKKHSSTQKEPVATGSNRDLHTEEHDVIQRGKESFSATAEDTEHSLNAVRACCASSLREKEIQEGRVGSSLS